MHDQELKASQSEDRARPSPALVLTLGLGLAMQSPKPDAFYVVETESAHDALHVADHEDMAVMVLGVGVKPLEALEILNHVASRASSSPAAAIVLCNSPSPELFQKFVDEGQLFYLARGAVSAAQIGLLIECAVRRFHRRTNREQSPLSPNCTGADRLLDLCVRLPMQADVRSAGRLLVETVRTAVGASNVRCLLYDQDEEILTSADAPDGQEWSYSAAAGLAAFVARTGKGIRLDTVGTDPRYDPDTDSIGERDSARFVAEPIFGPKGSAIGVIVAVRAGDLEPFSPKDVALVQFVAECAAPTLGQILFQNGLQKQLTMPAIGSESNLDFFRTEALEYHIRGWGQQGPVLRTPPAWLQRAYWVLLALFLAGLLGLALFIPAARNVLEKVI